MVAKIKTRPVESLIGPRLRMEMKKLGISSAELAERADVKTSFLYDVMSGKSSNPSTVKLARVADALGITLTYLAGASNHPHSDGGRHTATTNAPDYVVVPRILVDISGGGGTLVSEARETEHYYFRREWISDQLGSSPNDLRMLYVCGDSMEPTLYHQDILLIDTSKKLPSPPGVFVLFDGFGLMAKRLEYVSADVPKRIRVISDNPQYSTYERSIGEMFIVGRVVWFARAM